MMDFVGSTMDPVIALQQNSKFAANAGAAINITNSGSIIGWIGSSGGNNLILTGVLGPITLTPPGASPVEQRNGTNSQTFQIYNTYANSGTDFERASLSFISNQFTIGAEIGGTGVNAQVNIATAGTRRWAVNSSGHLLGFADNTYDIGSSGANRPRNLIIAGTLAMASTNSGAVITGGTFTTANVGTTRANPAGNVSGMILQAGTISGQQFTIFNESLFSITFAVAGTSNVADGTADAINALAGRTFIWNSGTSQWYPSK
jgi:hypothetical protein